MGDRVILTHCIPYFDAPADLLACITHYLTLRITHASLTHRSHTTRPHTHPNLPKHLRIYSTSPPRPPLVPHNLSPISMPMPIPIPIPIPRPKPSAESQPPTHLPIGPSPLSSPPPTQQNPGIRNPAHPGPLAPIDRRAALDRPSTDSPAPIASAGRGVRQGWRLGWAERARGHAKVQEGGVRTALLHRPPSHYPAADAEVGSKRHCQRGVMA